ncbi:MAG: NAD-binding protein [Candidatus Omnitrophica bacterium]|nr:NAD-binding protein [Candidatus Omnitrophota bacterium]
MKIIIVGGGQVGTFLAERLAENHYVTLIEKSPRRMEMLAGNPRILLIEGDGCQVDTLLEAGIKTADVLAAVTGRDEDNLIICQLAKDVFKVRRTVARINDPRHEKIFFQLGVDIAVDSTAIIAKIIEEEVSLEDMINLCAFKRGKLSLVRVDLPEGSPVLNQPIKNLVLPEDTVLVAVLREDEFIVPRGEMVLQVGDEVIALTKVENEKEVLHALVGELR